MHLARHVDAPARSPRRPFRLLLAGCALSAVPLGAAALGGVAGASSAPAPLQFFQKESMLTFTNASDTVIQGYPPVGGHVLEDDIDYAGNHAHHAAQPTMTDHLFCTVATAPATATCSFEFATGNSLLYADGISVNLASSAGTIPLSGGTGKFVGDTGSVASTPIGNGNNSDIVLTLHRS